jgi:hypothetical protein
MIEFIVSRIDGQPIARYRLVEPGDYMIGRDRAHADIVINDKSVSRQHAVVRYRGGRVLIADAGSLNGTSVGAIDRIPSLSDELGERAFVPWEDGETATVGLFLIERIDEVTRPIARAEAETELTSIQSAGKRKRCGRVDQLSLAARWRMRLVLDGAIGLPLALVIAFGQAEGQGLAPGPLAFWLGLALTGMMLEPVYLMLPFFGGDNAHPVLRHAVATLIEAAITVAVLRSDIVPGFESCLLARLDRVTHAEICVTLALPAGLVVSQLLAILLFQLIFVRRLHLIGERRATRDQSSARL